jgi:hypothetical protein
MELAREKPICLQFYSEEILSNFILVLESSTRRMSLKLILSYIKMEYRMRKTALDNLKTLVKTKKNKNFSHQIEGILFEEGNNAMSLKNVVSLFDTIVRCGNRDCFISLNKWCKKLGYHDDIYLPIHEYEGDGLNLIYEFLGNSRILPSSWFKMLKQDIKDGGVFISSILSFCEELCIYDILSEEEFEDLYKLACRIGDSTIISDLDGIKSHFGFKLTTEKKKERELEKAEKKRLNALDRTYKKLPPGCIEFKRPFVLLKVNHAVKELLQNKEFIDFEFKQSVKDMGWIRVYYLDTASGDQVISFLKKNGFQKGADFCTQHENVHWVKFWMSSTGFTKALFLPTNSQKYQLIQDYINTIYTISNLKKTIEIDLTTENSELFAFVKSQRAKSWGFITADNPGSLLLSSEENLNRREMLRQKLISSNLTNFEGLGEPRGSSSYDDFHERGWFILNISKKRINELAFKFGQNAFLWGTTNSADLIWTEGCKLP